MELAAALAGRAEEHRDPEFGAQRRHALLLRGDARLYVGFGRIVVPEMEAPNNIRES